MSGRHPSRRWQRLRWWLIPLIVFVASLTTTGSLGRCVECRMLIPLGRSSVVGPNRYGVSVDGEPWDGPVIADGYGGYWLDASAVAADGSTLVLQITVVDGSVAPADLHDSALEWLEPSSLIDSDHPTVTAMAARITAHSNSRAAAAEAIHAHLHSTLTWSRNRDHHTDPASATLTIGHGACGNFARSFVALARASGIPARTVQGVIYDGTDADQYHQWAEYRDEYGTWHRIDATTAPGLDSKARLYVDLIYASEENTLWLDPATTVVADTTRRSHDGRLGFRLIAESPASSTIENRYRLTGL